MTASDTLRRIHELVGDFYAEITVDPLLPEQDLNFNVALSKTDDERIGVLSFNAATVEAALEKALAALIEERA
jgi:hypothetical protein